MTMWEPELMTTMELRAEVTRLRTDAAKNDAEWTRLRTELDAAEALARGAQYREREALATVEVLRARLDALRGEVATPTPCSACGDPADAATRLCAECDVDPGDAGAWMRAQARAADVGDLAGLGRREGRVWTVTAGEGEGR